MNYRMLSAMTFFSILFALSMATAQTTKNIQKNLIIPDSAHVQVITTQDKSTMLGRILEIREKDVLFKAEFGMIVIPIDKIVKIELVPVSSLRQGEYWFPNPNATRLFFAPTARMLKKGDGYFADYYLFFPAVAYGITDNITIGGGMSLIPWIDFSEQVFYFTPKVGLSATEKFAFGAGALIIKIPGIGKGMKTPFLGIVYGVGTYGSPNSSLTVGLGYGFVDDDFAEKPMVIIGGEHRISRRLALVTENWILPGVDKPGISYGMRFFGERMSVDLALLNTVGKSAIFPGIPYVDFVFNF